eukprot:Clim_evm43s157 gene=Clim_evmTU43s157
MGDYMIVSLPGDRSREGTFNRIQSAVGSYGECYRFLVPDLKVGTLDALVGTSDELSKFDQHVAGVVSKMANTLETLLEDHMDRYEESLTVGDRSVSSYLKNWSWNGAKFATRGSLTELVDMLSKACNSVDTELQSKLSAYNQLRNQINSFSRKQAGNLLTKDLSEVVKKEHFVQNSEFMTTMLVCVPTAQDDVFLNCYEKLTQFVVPRSAREIARDQEYILYAVIVFERVAEEFKNCCRDKRFIVRDFVYDEEALAEGKREFSKMESDYKKRWTNMVRWCKTNFGEVFEVLVHVKALRVFTESVLRYGLPVNFEAALIDYKRNSQKRIHSNLNSLVGATKDSLAPIETDLAGLGVSEDYYPYTMVDFDLSMLKPSSR